MAQVSTPPDRMMHRFLDWRDGFSPPVRSWMVEREDSKIDRNWSTLDELICVLGVEFVMVVLVLMEKKMMISKISKISPRSSALI